MLGASSTLYPASVGGREVTSHQKRFYEISEDGQEGGEFDAPLSGRYAVRAEFDKIEGRNAVISSEGFHYLTSHIFVQVANWLRPLVFRPRSRWALAK